ncbi:MAG TPA: zinc-binding dehydrogenase [Candidatus Baltobacteraceae bacterium]|nr:zinc-binding dehydrogenase [Candidatus Baltobacteraceae bacterium]
MHKRWLIVADVDAHRLALADQLGAAATVNSSQGDAAKRILELTGGRGVDVAIEAVGVPATFVLCQDIVAPGGVVANVGVHGTKVDLHLEKLWSANITITTRLVDTITTPMLLKALAGGKVDAKPLITHHFPSKRILDAYETFAHAGESHALKVIIDF